MNADSEDLRGLWQSQPVGLGGAVDVPRFALLDELTVPAYQPLSLWRRIGYQFGFLWIAGECGRGGFGDRWPLQVAGAAGVLVAVVGIGLTLRGRDRSRGPLPEESIQAYRAAVANEFEHQFKLERPILWTLACGWFAALLLPALKAVESHGWQVALPAVGILGVLLLGLRTYLNVANAVRSRLRRM